MDDYKVCPLCDQPTYVQSNLTPLSAEEANKLASEVRFEEFYEEYCAKRGQPVAGPLPDKSFEEEVGELLSEAH